MDVVKESVDKFEQLSTHQRKTVVATLAGLLEVCVDGEAGYMQAAEDVTSPELEALFETFAHQRRQFANQLREVLETLGVSSDEPPPSIRSRLHRRWLDARKVLDKGGAVAMISECERGEHAALWRYEAALKIQMPMSVQGVLLDQVTEIRKAHDELERMRHPW